MARAAHGFLGTLKLGPWAESTNDGDGDTSAVVDISRHCTSADLAVTTGTADVTGFLERHKSTISGQSDGSLSVAGNWHDDVAPVLFGPGAGAEFRAFEFAQTSTSGEPRSTGKVVLTQVALSVSKADAVKFTLTAQVTDKVTVDAIA